VQGVQGVGRAKNSARPSGWRAHGTAQNRREVLSRSKCFPGRAEFFALPNAETIPDRWRIGYRPLAMREALRYALNVSDPFLVSQIFARISRETFTGGWLASILVTLPAK